MCISFNTSTTYIYACEVVLEHVMCYNHTATSFIVQKTVSHALIFVMEHF